MKSSRVIVQWRDGLHLRRAARLVQLGQKFRSRILLKCGENTADLRSILSVIALCATMGTSLLIEATGDDERDAADAVEQMFSINDSDGAL
ncbi:MAG: phosphocarrier protein HPr [Chthoniobacter sp.]|jgi:phosphocarrier protein|nr:phosphocarrier protein HPr [Chthoniobacter sp.]